jgi:hypothetical protein
VVSDLARLRLRPAHVAIVACVVLTTIFWGNLFRFHPAMIDHGYDSTSDGLVVGRLARAAADGVFNQTDLGSNVDPKHNIPPSEEWYNLQIRYYEHPDLIHSLGLGWGVYPSHFALEGFVLAIIDLINPLPRHLRIGFYHLLMSLFTAGMLVWIAAILRARFGWPAFFGFLVLPAVEPMFSAMAPNLYWVVGSWFVPMALAMLLADEDEPWRRKLLIASMFLAYLAKFLCGYEYTSTVILAAVVGCLLGVKERPDLLRHVFRNAIWVIAIGVIAFVVAAVMHAAKQDGFAVFLEKATNRVLGDAPSLQEQLLLGKFAPISAVIWTYLGGNYITLIKNYGFLSALIAGYALLILLDERFNWFYGAGRRKLQILALAALASFVAPLSWLVLAKAHSFDHPPIAMILWYVPTIPLGFAMLATAAGDFREYLALKRGDAARSWLVASIPALLVGAVIALNLIDRKIETTGTWVINEQANAAPIFDSEQMGVDFRMSNEWFTVEYPCPADPANVTFKISAEQDGATVDYSFRMDANQVFRRKGTCIAAQSKSDRPVSRISFGEISKQGLIWQRDATIALPDTFKPQPLSNSDWDRGVSRSRSELLLEGADFSRLLIKKGDEVRISSTDRRTIVSIASAGLSKVLMLEGAPIRLADGVAAEFGIIRK